ncbi:MAG: prepilin-type N-terminal cleavage/methylation domain-containing protein [Treponema sp.]|nr:prepilin-type N-terminal cleavage/methylation domain-containing protein [Treponema sp.]
MKHKQGLQTDAGFTLMETLLSVAIILILGSLLVIASNTTIQGMFQSSKTTSTATAFTRIDRHIRIMADAVHIPYWANPIPYIEAFTAELYRSKTGAYIKSVRIISDRHKVPRGIEVVYSVNGYEMQTTALFSSITIMDAIQ